MTFLSNKAPRSDGFRGKFFKKSWEIIRKLWNDETSLCGRYICGRRLKIQAHDYCVLAENLHFRNKSLKCMKTDSDLSSI